MGLLRRAPLVAALLLVFAAAPASAAPAPFGHACAPQDGVRFCPTADLASRVPSWDGTPLDVDVTLPAEGDGPFPTLVLHHGLGGTKTSFEGLGSGDPLYNNVALAQRGFAVVTPTARGFGNSCGKPESRTAGCETGFTRLMDIRYEVRDIQHLLGLLVDDGTAKADALGATGVSYGGGMSMMLAFLRNRVKNPNGSETGWTSPKGTRLQLAAAWPRWGWTNGAAIFTRNGRDTTSSLPFGLVTKAYADAIFAVGGLGYVAPPGGDVSADVTSWKTALDSGRITAQSRAILDNAYRNHGVTLLQGEPVPLMIQQGWTDALFPAPQAIGPYTWLRKMNPGAPISLQLGDLGHAPGANHPNDVAAMDRQGIAFLESHLLGKGTKPAPGSVTAYTMTCPKSAPSGGGPFTAAQYSTLAARKLRITTKATFRITSKGASQALADELAPVTGKGADLCTKHRNDPTSKAKLSVKSPGMTLIGQPVLTGRAVARGGYASIIARLWDYDPTTRTQRLITRGAYRLDQGSHRFTFPLDGNGWKFAKGHLIVLEMLGRDSPTYLPAPNAFSAKLSGLRFALPVREAAR